MSIFVKDRNFYKTFFKLTLIIALQNVIVFGVNLADNIMLGRYGETSMSGVLLVNQIQFLLQMIVMGIGEGMIVLSSRAWGRKDIAAIKKVTSIGMRIGVISGLVIFGVAFAFPKECLSLLSDKKEIISEGVKYLKIICFSYVFFAVTNILLASLRSVETTIIGFFVSFSTLIINVCLNYILIFGNFGAPRLGVQGAAIATLTARIIEFVIILLYVGLVDKKIHLRFKDFVKIDFELLKEYVRTGLPVILSNLMWGLAMSIQTAILGHMTGEEIIGANSIATTVFQIVTVISYGAASASAVVVGKMIGEGMADKMKSYARTLQVIYLCIGVVTGITLFLFKNVIIDFYNISEVTKALALKFMNVLSVTVMGTSYQVAVLTGIVRGGGDTRFVLYNDMIFMWGIVLPVSAIAAFALNLSPVIVFICLKSDQILKCFVAVVKVNRGRWIKKIDIKDTNMSVETAAL